MEKLPFSGHLLSVQPRIRLTRSFDERSHTYLGYSLFIKGNIGNDAIDFSIGIGKAAQAKNEFRIGDVVSGEAMPVVDSGTEPVDYYKSSKLKVVSRGAENTTPPPWHDSPPELVAYRERGHCRYGGHPALQLS